MRFAIDMLSRKNRSASTTSPSSRSRRLRQSVQRAAQSMVESLENRQLLASVSGGQVGIFQGPNGQSVRITMTGTGSLDFIGATRDVNGQPQMNDIPMTIFDQDGNVVRENLGGYAGRRGIRLANLTVGDGTNDSEFVGNTDPYFNVPSGRVALDGLASNNLGKTYGVNRYQQGTNAVVDILRVDSTSGNVKVDSEVSDEMLAELQQANPAIGKPDILGVIGADFPPDDANLLYFAVNINYPFITGGGNNPTITRKVVPAMFTYNLSTKQVILDPNFFGLQTQEDTIRVDDFTFLDNGQIAIFGSLQRGNGGGEAAVGLFFSDPNSVVLDPDNFAVVRIGEQAPGQPPPPATTSLAAIEAIPGEDYIIAVTVAAGVNGATDGDNAQLVKINIGNLQQTGRGLAIGSIVDPDEDTNIQLRLGESVRDLTWNSRVTDHYFQPGKRGVLLGEDASRDQLVAFDIRERFANTDLYAVFGQDVRSDTAVSITEFTPDSRQTLTFNQRLFLGAANPFGGSAGVLRTNMVPGDPVNINLDNGGLYLGIRTLDINQTISVPVLGLDPKTDFVGGRPGVAFPKLVRPGVYISGTMRSFLFGGTITGSVNIDGSIDTFYAGNVVTGDPLNGRVNGTDNFFVNGDLRNLIVRGGLGTLDGAPPDDYHPRTDILIGGRVQMIKTGDDYRGAIDIAGKTSEQTIGSALTELEFTPNLRALTRAGRSFTGDQALTGGELKIVDPITRNDSFNTPQMLGSYFSKNRKRGGQVTLNGTINNGPNFLDQDDYYGIPLLAGQTVQVRAETTSSQGDLITYSIVDPNGVVYATDQSNVNTSSFLNQALQFTADKPGVWRIQVSAYTPNGGLLRIDEDRNYALTVDKIGEMGLGGLFVGGETWFDRADMGLRVRSNDLGAILGSGQVFGADASDILSGRNTTFVNPIEASSGNLRSIRASGISFFDDSNNRLGRFPNISVPRGSVGEIHSDSQLYFNILGLTTIGGNLSPAAVIGGDIQLIETPGDFTGNVAANGSIGVIRVGSFAVGPADDILIQNSPGYIGINQDNKGTAELGLIDVAGDLGSFQFGGPTINVGDGGNARYLRVGGLVYRRALAGTGGVTVLTGVDKAVTLLDDSGATVTLAPYNGVAVTSNASEGSDSVGGSGIPDPFGGNGNPNINGSNGIPDPFGGNGNPSVNGSTIPNPFGGSTPIPGGVPTSPPVTDIVGTLSVSAYPVQSGGFMIYDVQSTTGLAVSSTNGTADLTTVDFVPGPDGATPEVINPASRFDEVRQNPSVAAPLVLGSGTTRDVVATGDRVNIYLIRDAVVGQEDVARVINNTDGEIVNFRARDLGYMNAEWIGSARPVNGVKIEPLAPAVERLPGGSRTGVTVANAIDIRSRGPLGNITVFDEPGVGVLQNLEANSDDVNTKGVFEGINGPIDVTGYLRRVDIGEGLAYSGSGNKLLSGIYLHDDGTTPEFAEGSLGLVTNENGHGDLVGDIIVDTYLEGISLTGGASIFNADIYQLASLIAGVDSIGGFGTEQVRFNLDQVINSIDNSILEGMGNIRISGNGGIMSSRIVGYNMGKIITDKFSYGLVSSEIESSSGARQAGTDVGGLGIRNTIYSGGSFMGTIKANGNGKVLDVRNFSRTIRSGAYGYFDPLTGIAPNSSIDIDLALGTSTSKKLTAIDGVTNAGVIQNSTINSARSIDGVSAYEIRGVDPFGARPRDDFFVMQITAANSIGNITTQRNINGLRILGGSIGTVSAGRDIVQFQLNANQRVKGIVAGRNILGTSNFTLTNNGSLDLLQAGGNVNGTGFAPKGIRAIVVGGNLGTARAQGGIRSGTDINLLQVGGDISGTALIRANRMIKQFILEGDLQEDAAVRANSYGTQKINGTVFGQIITG